MTRSRLRSVLRGTGSPGHGRAQAAPCHVGVLGSVADAESIRDLMLERLRRLKSSGLGDPDDRHDMRHREHAEHPVGSEVGGESRANSTDVAGVLGAAREALEEVRALRQHLCLPGTGPSRKRKIAINFPCCLHCIGL